MRIHVDFLGNRDVHLARDADKNVRVKVKRRMSPSYRSISVIRDAA